MEGSLLGCGIIKGCRSWSFSKVVGVDSGGLY
jgi:hypothetical protein